MLIIKFSFFFFFSAKKALAKLCRPPRSRPLTKLASYFVDHSYTEVRSTFVYHEEMGNQEFDESEQLYLISDRRSLSSWV
jgi:hypothetical protein